MNSSAFPSQGDKEGKASSPSCHRDHLPELCSSSLNTTESSNPPKRELFPSQAVRNSPVWFGIEPVHVLTILLPFSLLPLWMQPEVQPSWTSNNLNSWSYSLFLPGAGYETNCDLLVETPGSGTCDPAVTLSDSPQEFQKHLQSPKPMRCTSSFSPTAPGPSPAKHSMSRLPSLSPKGKQSLEFLLPRSCFTHDS